MKDNLQKTTQENVSNQSTLYWHDYETFGLNAGADRPAQFAAIRTDLDFNIISEPNEWFCRPPDDYLPNPEACLITGITPQQALQQGLFENEFIKRINTQFSQADTCVLGYNNIRFDDEVTRFTLYRNFYDPYQREWQNGCSRWDIIDLVRACYALRPEGINWPVDENDIPSFRLELLTKANGLAHSQAHDAMSDVYATIAMAKLIKNTHPKLYEYCFNLRKKAHVLSALKIGSYTPLVHISGMFPAQQGCVSYVLPLAEHPLNKNAIIVVDLNKDLSALETLSVEEIRQYLYTPTIDLPEGIDRPAIKLVHINKCPIIAPAKTLTEARADELGINRSQCRASLEFLKSNTGIAQKCQMVFAEETKNVVAKSVEEMLYTGGFFSNADKTLINQISASTWEELADANFKFTDKRLDTLLWHYRARNGAHSLTSEEQDKWTRHRQAYLLEHSQTYIEKLDALALEYRSNPAKIELLKQLHNYLQFLACL
ncbi:exodeoxyribonuclease I [Psychromonas antarctica]|uniref:exodeoxyribonuclease I n=1 Tax=Psychromonas antarctica TaxID=67573 RepID=UPI001EE7A4F4|nr:exodeoxyribonuclease I [Psychromonas antarctica]MCG6202202.1 exodeoxyribonuclease I [Psychromonas antarctica]